MKQMFYGGVHPAEHKEATEQKPIQPLANAPAQVVIPMSMHIGARRVSAHPSTPVFLARLWRLNPVPVPAVCLRFLS